LAQFFLDTVYNIRPIQAYGRAAALGRGDGVQHSTVQLCARDRLRNNRHVRASS